MVCVFPNSEEAVASYSTVMKNEMFFRYSFAKNCNSTKSIRLFPVDGIRAAIDTRDKAIRDELAEFARGKKSRADLGEQIIPVLSAATA